MKAISLTQLRSSFWKLQWLMAGERKMAITKRGRIVAILSRPRRAKPDFAKRFAMTKADKVRHGKSVVDVLLEERDSYRR
jgi:hypothetical protein